MDNNKLKQANFRLPAPLIEELRKVSEATANSQSEIVRKAIEAKVERLKIRLDKQTAAAA